MLVLTCKEDEQVIIEVDGLDKPIVMTLVRCGQGRSRIGFTHPDFDKVRFYRDSVYDRVLLERKTPERENQSCLPVPPPNSQAS